MSKKYAGKHSNEKIEEKELKDEIINKETIDTETTASEKTTDEKTKNEATAKKETTKKETAKKETTKEETTSEETENNKETNKKRNRKILVYFFIVVLLIELIYGGYILLERYGKKFKNVEIEIGTSQKVAIQDFLKHEKYAENAELITNLEDIDYGKVGEYEVILSYEGREEKVILKLVDTTPPEVKFKDIERYIDYQITPDDFIEEKTDLSEMTTEIIDAPQINEFGDYPIQVMVKDSCGNQTTQVCKLSIKWIREEFTMEVGHELVKEDLLFNVEVDGDLLDSKQLKEISNSKIGEYPITVKKGDSEKIVTIKVTDLTPPDLVLKDVTIYNDEKVKGKESFIRSATDASGAVTTTMKTEINYSQLGTQEIVIEAVDQYGNKVEKTATLTIMEDTVGPVFSGLSDISINKEATIHYEQGVTAKDAKDGVCQFSVNSSAVNTSVAGTYYATYTSSDKKGNKTSAKRKIVVKHDQSDINALVKSIASKIGNDVEAIRDYCRNNIKYSHSYGDNDPIWYGFNNWQGNCYVHALCFQALLKEKGYETQLIWVTNKTHYWNLVKINGVWRHMDSTPDRNHRKISIMTDEQRLSTLSGRDWDHSLWPAAK